MRRRLALRKLLLCTAAAVVLPVHAGSSDLHPLREPPRDATRLRAQEMAKLKLIAKLRGEAPRLAERAAADASATLDAPIFHRYDRP